MLRVDGAYLYDLGSTLRSIKALEAKDTERIEVMIALFTAKDKLAEFVYSSVFQSGLRTLQTSASAFLASLRELVPEFEADVNFSEIIPAWKITTLHKDFGNFEAVLIANLQAADLYFVSPKGGFDTQALTDGGLKLFPPDLATKAPEALDDVAAATRCIAFELPTAAAFHLMRVNEAVLRRYFDEKVGTGNRPTSRNMADFINGMKTRSVGDARVLEALKALKDLHRNPLMHPDASIGSIEEAINLYAAVRATIGYMLADMTGELSAVVAPLPLEEPPQPSPTAPLKSVPQSKPIRRPAPARDASQLVEDRAAQTPLKG